jgi:hypothetical protein
LPWASAEQIKNKQKLVRISNKDFTIAIWPIPFHVLNKRNERFSVAQASACVLLTLREASKNHTG